MFSDQLKFHYGNMRMHIDGFDGVEIKDKPLLHDATVFSINEGFYKFLPDVAEVEVMPENPSAHYVKMDFDKLIDDFEKFTLPTYLPFDNILLQFNDGVCFWITEVSYVGADFNDVDERVKVIMFYAFHKSVTPIPRPKVANNGFVDSYFFFPFLPSSLKMKEGTKEINFSQNLTFYEWFPEREKDQVELNYLHNLLENQDFDLARMGIIQTMIIKRFMDVLSCKNIGIRDIPTSKKMNVKRTRKGKVPFCSYKVLQIYTKGDKGGSGGDAQGLWSNRVHLCRGHIKTYTEDKPLFGKFVGNVWCPPHMRGNKGKGEVLKDYKV